MFSFPGVSRHSFTLLLLPTFVLFNVCNSRSGRIREFVDLVWRKINRFTACVIVPSGATLGVILSKTYFLSRKYKQNSSDDNKILRSKNNSMFI